MVRSAVGWIRTVKLSCRVHFVLQTPFSRMSSSTSLLLSNNLNEVCCCFCSILNPNYAYTYDTKDHNVRQTWISYSFEMKIDYVRGYERNEKGSWKYRCNTYLLYCDWYTILEYDGIYIRGHMRVWGNEPSSVIFCQISSCVDNPCNLLRIVVVLI